MNKRFFIYALAVLLVLVFTGCSPAKTADSFPVFTSYLDIPDITEQEIAEIKALQKSRTSFIYAMENSAECFINDNGEIGGFSALFCDWMEELFGIDFVPTIYDWDEILSGLENQTIDFAGDLTKTPEREQIYFMTNPIAMRSVKVMRLAESQSPAEIALHRPLRYIFIDGAVTYNQVAPYLDEPFEVMFVDTFFEVYQALRNREADAFFDESPYEAAFDVYGDIIAEDFFPFIYGPVSLTTGNPELKPIISVVQKALENGATRHLTELYNQGYRDYLKNKYFSQLSESELQYIRTHIETSKSIPIGLEFDNYPTSFYNQYSKVWQGISFDVLKEIEYLTGLTFEIIHENELVDFSVLLNKLEKGEIAVLSEVIPTPERQGRFLFSEPYAVDNYALISTIDFPDMKINEILYLRVGLQKATAYAEVFQKWFPDHPNTVEFMDAMTALNSLERGEIDVFMGTRRQLLSVTNFLEKPGFKSNIVFNRTYDSSFGISIYEPELHSIINRAQRLIDTKTINDRWMARTFDYRSAAVRARTPYLIGASVLLLFVIALLVVMYTKGKLLNTKLEAAIMEKTNVEARIKLMFDSTPLAVTLWNKELQILDCNRHTLDAFGHKSKQAFIDNFIKIMPEYQPDGSLSAEKVVREITKAFNEGYNHLEWLHATADGELLPLDATLVRINLHDDYAVVIYARDLREHKKMLEEMKRIDIAEASSKAKSQFLATMSHEIRTPMNAIIGMAELSLRENLTDKARDHVQTIKQAGANLLSIINDILDFSKIESGKMEIVPQDYLFSSLVNDVISIIRMKVVGTGIRFVANIDSNIPNKLCGDEIRIRQVMLNILSNAVKYTEMGFVSLSIHGELQDNLVRLVIDVTDSGKGIKEEDMVKLFGDFSQVDMASNKGIEGTGLGLSIARNLANAMGGDITVKSEYGVGSTFTITLTQEIRSNEKLALVDNPDEKSVLVYEPREIYAESIVYTIDNLGVLCALVTDESEFFDVMESMPLKFVFVASELLTSTKRVLEKLKSDAQIVLLAEFGEAVSNEGLATLAMPVQTISVANILNGVADNFSYNENMSSSAKFIAPEAKVLVVDDIETNLAVAEGLMAPYKTQLQICTSGFKAIELVQAEDFDLIFMDHMMPEMDGVEAVAKIRGLADEKYRTLPIIALTANAVSGTKEMFLSNGFNDFLSKPIDIIKMNSILESWIPVKKQKAVLMEHSDFTANTNNYKEKLLATFKRDAEKAVITLRETLVNGDIKLFTTTVHAMKAALANIGEAEKSQTAGELEDAARNGDSDFIAANAEDFIKELEIFTSSLFPAEKESTSDVDIVEDKEFLFKQLGLLKTACEEYDDTTAYAILDSLEERSWRKETWIMFEDIRNSLYFDSDFDVVVKQIDEFTIN